MSSNNFSMTLRQLYNLLLSQVPSESWWPANTDFEIIVGAILTQNTAWRNVTLAINDLKKADLLDANKLLKAEDDVIKALIRPSGYFNSKSRYLKEASVWFLNNDQNARSTKTKELRSELLNIYGIGPETADVILLYIYGRPVFIYDLYARRLFRTAGFGDFKNYQSAKKAIDPLVKNERFTTEELAEFHGLIVDAGKIAREQGGWKKAFPQLLKGTF